MTYNIHPILVHFPIAFLLLYSLLIIFPLDRWFPRIVWKDIKKIILVAGVLGAFASSATGEIAEQFVRGDHSIVEVHSFFAGFSTIVYAVLLGSEFLHTINEKIIVKLKVIYVTKFFVILEHILTHRIFMVFASIVGLVAISVTGLLGGILVYGVTADPLAPLLLQILGL